MTEIAKTKEPTNADFAGAKGSCIAWVMVVYFCSGLCSLIDEVVWVRLLKLTLGNTVYASSIVVSVFMGGLALGALIMSRYADRLKRRLRLYAILEMCAAISALSLPWVMRYADGVYRWFYVKLEPSPKELLVMQVILSACILLVPSMIMGSTLPLLGRYTTALQQQVGRLVGRLYALNMLGAALGCYLAGFVLIRLVGVMGALYIAAIINIMVAFAGLVLSRYEVESEGAAETPAVRTQPQDMDRTGSRSSYVLMLGFFASGFISIGYEIIWMRSIVHLFGGFTYVFSAVLTIYLLGNVIGVWIGTGLSKRLRCPAAAFGVSLTCLGVLGVLYIPYLALWGSKVAPFITTLVDETLMAPGSVYWTVLPLVHSVFLFLLPALTMGIGFPLALQGWGNYRHKVGQTTGTVYGVNTIGAVMGGVLTGFVLIPSMGTQVSITILGLTGIWLGAVMLQTFAARPTAIRRTVYLAIATGLTITAVMIPSSLFKNQFVQWKNTRLLGIKEGVTTTVGVLEKANGELVLTTSGIGIAGDQRSSCRIPQKILGHLGILLNKKTRSALSVGFGCGETTACMEKHDLERIESVEISPELVEMALKFFKHLNLADRLNKEVNMIYMDAKNYLHLTKKRYDLIVNDCISPRAFADNASLYTKEYFQDAMNHLNHGGIFGTYLPVSDMSISCTNSILGTFMEVFPYVTVWFPVTAPSRHDFWYVAGAREPLLFSPKYIDDQLRRETVHKSAGYINLNNSHYVLSCYIADQNELKSYLNDFKLNSDFRPYVEFNTDRNESQSVKKAWLAKFFAKVRHDNIYEHIDWTGFSDDQQEKWRHDHKLYYKASTNLLASRTEEAVENTLENNYVGSKLMPEHPAFAEQEIKSLFRVKGMLAEGQADMLLEQVEILLKKQPEFGTAWLIKSWALNHKNEVNRALSAAEKARQHAPDTAHVHYNLASILLKIGRPADAIECFAEATRLDPTNAQLRFYFGGALARLGQFEQAISQFRRGLEIKPRNAQAHYFLGTLLEKQGKKDEAIEEYRNTLRINPEHWDARNRLDGLSALRKDK